MTLKPASFELKQGEITRCTDHVMGTVLPLPFAPFHVNIWFLKTKEGWAVFDCGFNFPEGRKIWTELIFPAISPITKIIVSHFHLDHAGLAGWVAKETGARIYATEREWFMMHFLQYEPTEHYIHRIETHYLQSGLEGEEARKLSLDSHIYPKLFAPLPPHFTPLETEDSFENWEVQTVRGHAQDMVTLIDHASKTLISCDHILPNITPNISTLPIFETQNPLGLYLKDLERFKTVGDDYLILPSHGQAFYKVSREIARNIGHHDNRLDRILEICKDKPQTAFEIANLLFKRKFEPAFFFYLLGEALSHITYLVHLNKLDCVNEKGIYQYKTL